MNRSSARIEYLDALRGIAILSVVLFHAYYRWNDIEPYEQNEFLSSSFRYGWLGVQLFFSISGYVIYMSLIKSDNLFHFAANRWLRLFPAMIFATFIIFTSAFYIPYRPLGEPALIDIFPGVSFIDPIIINSIFDIESKSLDGVFWSLYVEVKFYAFAAFLFFVLRDRYLVLMNATFIVYAILIYSSEINIIDIDRGYFKYVYLSLRGFGIQHYGWFLLGIYSYLFFTEGKKLFTLPIFLFSAIAISLLYIEKPNSDIAFLFACLFVLLLFLSPLQYESMRRFLSQRILIFLGFISYPLYLLHQNMVSGLAIHFAKLYPDLPPMFYPLPFILAVFALAFAVAKLEPHVKFAIKKRLPNQFLGRRLK